MRLNYYAKLNENEVCTEIVSTKKDLKGIRGFIKLPDYNETVLYRRWQGDQWSRQTYEPTLETQLQDRLDELEKQNESMREELTHKQDEISQLEKELKEKQELLDSLTQELKLTNDALAELMEIIFMGGEE